MSNPNHRYRYMEDNGQFVAAMGVRENKYGSGGYEMDSDYEAARKFYEKNGYGKLGEYLTITFLGKAE